MRRALVVGWVLWGCRDREEPGTTPETPYTFDCEVSEADDLGDPFAGIVGNEHACEEAPMYVPSVPWATSYFVGTFHYDDCGNLRGKETWVLYANDTWEDLGGHDCRVVWDVDGTALPSGGDDLLLEVDAVMNSAETTCGDIENGAGEQFLDEDFVPPTYQEAYQLSRIGREATFFFQGGDEFGRGEANDNHSTYLSERNCMAF